LYLCSEFTKFKITIVSVISGISGISGSVSIGREHFTDLDYSDDVTLLAEMLHTLDAGGRTVGTTG